MNFERRKSFQDVAGRGFGAEGRAIGVGKTCDFSAT
jgi:hypothetical protein